MENRKIAIITINYNTESLIERFIDSIVSQTYKNWLIAIANNSDSDKILNRVIQKYSEIEIYVVNINKNVGYSKANNISFEYLKNNNKLNSDDLVLVSNEDIVMEDSDFLKKSVEFFDKDDCSFIGPKIINNDGSMMLPHKKETGYLKCLLHFGNNGIADKIFNINSYFKKIINPSEVFLINGACFFARFKDFDKVGMFDENTFIYYAEELLFRKVKNAGLKVKYIPEIYVKHDHSGTVKKNYNPVFKKKFVYEAEIYFLTGILRVKKFLLLLFKAERKIEFVLISLFYKISKTKIYIVSMVKKMVTIKNG